MNILDLLNKGLKISAIGLVGVFSVLLLFFLFIKLMQKIGSKN